MTYMIAYQQAYNAAARFMTAIDETLRTLIQNTGLVGADPAATYRSRHDLLSLPSHPAVAVGERADQPRERLN